MNTAADVAREAPVLFEERGCSNGARVAVATLNAPATLNGLSLAMVDALDARLQVWDRDDRIALVILQGAGEKAFCAGGDLHGLYRGILDYRAKGGGDIRTNLQAGSFFAHEYRLDHRIHAGLRKPVLCWGHGIVMGGGIGLMAGATHRVVSERSRLAFPEVTIGLYPDVAGSWLLSRVPRGAGLFLALTGAPLDAGDAIYARLADAYVPEARRAAVFAALQSEHWSGTRDDDAERLTAVIRRFAEVPAPGPLQRHADRVAAMAAAESLEAVIAAIDACDVDDAWIVAARRTLAAGAPGSLRLGYEMQRRAAALSLADTFRLEYLVSLHCAAGHDFGEGIRALLIDKDRRPRWNPATLAQADAAWLARHFEAPWSGHAHPLADLGSAAGDAA